MRRSEADEDSCAEPTEPSIAVLEPFVVLIAPIVAAPFMAVIPEFIPIVDHRSFIAEFAAGVTAMLFPRDRMVVLDRRLLEVPYRHARPLDPLKILAVFCAERLASTRIVGWCGEVLVRCRTSAIAVVFPAIMFSMSAALGCAKADYEYEKRRYE